MKSLIESFGEYTSIKVRKERIGSYMTALGNISEAKFKGERTVEFTLPLNGFFYIGPFLRQKGYEVSLACESFPVMTISW